MIDCSILSEIESELGTLGISIANVLPTESFCSEYARDGERTFNDDQSN